GFSGTLSLPFCRVIFLPSTGTTTLLSIHLSFERFWFARLSSRCMCNGVLLHDCVRAIFC
ncbi:hypothetical protein, partial [Streptococcus pneumoniae]|uniref:hypothetical protein n=1 Tax=Streptococcus pneumoniae TaxID=1313 RepID=UPI00307E9735